MDFSTFSPALVLVTVISLALAPFVAVMVTSFTKIVVVLSLLRNALGLQQVPPNVVINGLAIVLSIYVMYPVILDTHAAVDARLAGKPAPAMITMRTKPPAPGSAAARTPGPVTPPAATSAPTTPSAPATDPASPAATGATAAATGATAAASGATTPTGAPATPAAGAVPGSQPAQTPATAPPGTGQFADAVVGTPAAAATTSATTGAARPAIGGGRMDTNKMLAMIDAGKEPLRIFLINHSSDAERAFFLRSAQRLLPPERRGSLTVDDFIVIVPAFTVSELTAAFQIGFLIFLPFLIIDLVVSNILLALGMMMLSPTTVSLPFKLLLFVMINGWAKLVHGLVLTYGV